MKTSMATVCWRRFERKTEAIAAAGFAVSKSLKKNDLLS